MVDKVLVIAAHPDDEILGVGGTINKRVVNGDIVDCIILGEGMTSRAARRGDVNNEYLDDLHKDTLNSSRIIGFRDVFFSNLPDNRFDSVDLLDIVKVLEKYVNMLKPDIIYTHHYGDLNIDHKRTFEAVLTACRPVGEHIVREIYCFETLSSTEWNFSYENNTFKPNIFVDIQENLSVKQDAMACYKTELRDYPHPRSLKSLEIIAQRWGTVVGKKYVEAFELIRKID